MIPIFHKTPNNAAEETTSITIRSMTFLVEEPEEEARPDRQLSGPKESSSLFVIFCMIELYR